MEPLNAGLLDAIVVEHARQYVQMFVTQRSDQINEFSRGIPELLLRWVNGNLTFDQCWDVSFGEMTKLLTRTDVLLFDIRVANLAIRALECGQPGHIEVKIRDPVPLRWGNKILERTTILRATSDGRRCTLRKCLHDEWTTVQFERCDNTWTGTSDLPDFQMVKNVVRILPTGATAGIETNLVGKNADIDTSFCSECDAAFRLLKGFASVYVSWIDKVMRYLIPLQPTGLAVTSGSEYAQPGVIHISMGDCPVVIAEVFVHECTHHYMHILERLGPLCDAADTNLYYSPVKKTGRPLSGILTAFHAFMNVFLFYRLLQENGASSSEYCRIEEAKLIPQLMQLEATLSATTSLTEAGSALFQPLRTRFRECI
jgi:HEXXH motif-containing protein